MNDNNNEEEVQDLEGQETQDEEVSSQEEQNTENNIKEIEKGIKDGASLAKNAASGNILGAAKDALKLAKNKKIKKQLIIQAVMPIVIVIFIAVAFVSVLSAVGNTVLDIIGGIGQAITDVAGGIWEGILDFFNVQPDGAIEIETNQIDTIINSIDELGISAEDLGILGDYDESGNHTQEALRMYIRDFYEAQAVTENLNYQHKQSTDTTTYGAVYVYRANADDEDGTNRRKLTYVEYDDMVEMQEKGNTDALDYFSVDENGKMVIAGTNEIRVDVGDENSLHRDYSRSGTTINLRTIDYRSAISQYTTKMNFLIYLTTVSANPEFASAVADLIKDSRIEITIMDNISTYVSTEQYDYIQHTRTRVETRPNQNSQAQGPSTFEPTYVTYEDSKEEVTEITRTTTINTNPVANITYVKTWFCEQTLNYRRTTQNSEPTSSPGPDMPDEPAVTGENEGSWRTDQSITITEESTLQNYAESSRSDVEITLGNRGDGERYANGEISEPTFVGLMETEFRIPYSSRSEIPGINLRSGSGILFTLLQQDPDLENMETIMRHALNIFLGYEAYDVDLSRFNAFEASEFSTVSGLIGGSTQENIWFALREAGYSEIASAAVMGNIQLESGFNPAVVEGGTGIGFGICQWSFGRRDALEAYAASKGTDPSDLQTQIEFLLAELTPGGGANGYASFQMGGSSSSMYDGNSYTYNDWKNASDIETATVAFMALFERPSYDPEINHMSERLSAANDYYNQYQGIESSGSDGRVGTINLSEENSLRMSNMLSEAIRICEDNRYTYSQDNRNGEYQFDCSSFVYRLYQEYFGIQIPNTTSGYSTSSQYCVGDINSVDLQPGDVLWRDGHVEIYLGNGLTAGAKSGNVATADQIRISNVVKSNFTHVFRFITE